MAEGKSKTGVVKKRASKREKKDGIGLRRIYLLRRLPSAFWCSISGHLSRISGLVLMK